MDHNDQATAEVAAQLPEYRSHKRVWAAKVVQVIDNSGENCEAAIKDDSFVVWVLDNGGYVHVSNDLKMRGGDNPACGYFVKYADGFQSWSPARAFEEGYTRVKP